MSERDAPKELGSALPRRRDGSDFLDLALILRSGFSEAEPDIASLSGFGSVSIEAKRSGNRMLFSSLTADFFAEVVPFAAAA